MTDDAITVMKLVEDLSAEFVTRGFHQLSTF